MKTEASEKLRILFMGTPEFAVPSLDILLRNSYSVVGVVTAPDKPAGRGQKVQESAVKQFALKHNLTILQPTNLKDETFLSELESLQPTLQIVVAFRMLPEKVWGLPSLGTFNLHASLLPQYRGAAPIHWAVMNGEKETGVTTFFLQHEIDTGNILFQEKTSIGEEETTGELHGKLMLMGADLVLKTVKAIEKRNCVPIPQYSFMQSNIALKTAPKLLKPDGRIKWNNHTDTIFNHIRGLSPYPAAWTELISPEKNNYSIKIFQSKKEKCSQSLKLGSVVTDGKKYLKIAVKDGFIYLSEVQLAGKNKMSIQELLRGFKINNQWVVK